MFGMNGYGFGVRDDSYAGIVSGMLEDFVESGRYVTALTWWAGWALLSLALPYPMVLPGGAVASPASWLSLLVSLTLVVPCGLAARVIADHVPTSLAVAACACAPSGVVLVGLLWCVSACAVAIVVALTIGVIVFAVGRRTGGIGVMAPLCAIICAATAGLLLTLTVGGQMSLYRPELLSAGYARTGDCEGHGPLSDVAEGLASAVASADVGHACDGVVVAPYFTGVDGILMRWGEGPGGESLLLVSSEYLGSYSETKLEVLARDMLDKDADTAILYTRWLDGLLWLEATGASGTSRG